MASPGVEEQPQIDTGEEGSREVTSEDNPTESKVSEKDAEEDQTSAPAAEEQATQPVNDMASVNDGVQAEPQSQADSTAAAGDDAHRRPMTTPVTMISQDNGAAKVSSSACATAPAAGTRSRSRSPVRSPVARERLWQAFLKYSGDEEKLPAVKVFPLLMELDVSVTQLDVKDLCAAVAAEAEELSFEELMALTALVTTLGASSRDGHERRFLTQRQDYLYRGVLCCDPAVLEYVRKLQAHENRCKMEGRYLEAKATAQRLVQLRNAEGDRLRKEMLLRHASEQQQVERSHREEMGQAQREWWEKIGEYERQFEQTVERLKLVHRTEAEKLLEGLEWKRPVRPHYSKQLLNQRSIQESLAKLGQYNKAMLVQKAANQMEDAEMMAALANHSAEVKLKQARLKSRQQMELEAVLQRCARGRDELERGKTKDLCRRHKHYRNMLAELTNLQMLELVHLEAFLESQALAGKRMPLKDAVFRKQAALPLF